MSFDYTIELNKYLITIFNETQIYINEKKLFFNYLIT